MYCTISNKKSNVLRDDTVCNFKSEEICTAFGLIDLFIPGVDPTTLVYEMICLDDAILQQAGHPYRHSLLDYQEANQLAKYVIPVEYQTRSLNVVRIDSIIGAKL